MKRTDTITAIDGLLWDIDQKITKREQSSNQILAFVEVRLKRLRNSIEQEERHNIRQRKGARTRLIPAGYVNGQAMGMIEVPEE